MLREEFVQLMFGILSFGKLLLIWSKKSQQKCVMCLYFSNFIINEVNKINFITFCLTVRKRVASCDYHLLMNKLSNYFLFFSKNMLTYSNTTLYLFKNIYLPVIDRKKNISQGVK